MSRFPWASTYVPFIIWRLLDQYNADIVSKFKGVLSRAYFQVEYYWFARLVCIDWPVYSDDYKYSVYASPKWSDSLSHRHTDSSVTRVSHPRVWYQSSSNIQCVPKICTRFVVFCCCLVTVDFTHILQDYFIATGALLWVPRWQWINHEEYE